MGKESVDEDNEDGEEYEDEGVMKHHRDDEMQPEGDAHGGREGVRTHREKDCFPHRENKSKEPFREKD